MKKAIIYLILFICNLPLFSQIPPYIPTNGLQAWYSFTGNANDHGPGMHHGAVNGASLTTDRFGSAACAYLYNGISDYISVPDNVTLRPPNFTISSWITFTAVPTDYHIVIAKNAGAGSPESIDMNYATSHNGFFCNIGSPFANGPFLVQAYTVNVGPWYNFVYQYDDVNNVQTIYINGVFTASSVVNMSIGYDNKPWTFGMEYENNVPSFFWKGKIDDIGIWDRMLTPAELLQVYCSTGFVSQPSSQTVASGSTVSFTATASNPNSVYQWQHNPGTGFVNLSNTAQFSGVTTSVLTVANVSSANNNSTYRCIINTGTCTATSSTATLGIIDITGIDRTVENNFVVFPNPAADVIHLGSPNTSLKYEIINMLGVVISSGELQKEENKISVCHLQTGIYFISFEGQRHFVTRFIKQ